MEILIQAHQYLIDGASSPPIILSDDGRVLGKLSIGPGYQADRFDPYDIKYTCDWD